MTEHARGTGSASHRRAAPRPAGGFTLLELLVAVTVLGIVLLLALNGLRFGSRSWGLQQASAEQTAGTRVAREYLRRQLALTVPHVVGEGARERLVFEGEEHSLRFVAAMSRGRHNGARYLFGLAPETTDTTTRLMLEYALLDPSAQRLRALPAQRVVLIEDMETVEFSFFGRGKARQRMRWRSTWPADAEQLPRLVRVRVEVADRPEPLDLTVALPLHGAAIERRGGG
jgi:general secretion pathway protein J